MNRSIAGVMMAGAVRMVNFMRDVKRVCRRHATALQSKCLQGQGYQQEYAE